MGLVKITTVLLMIGLFSIALITFATNFANDNGATISVGSDSSLNTVKSNSTSNVNEFYSGSSTSYDAFQTSTIETQTQASEGGTQFKVTPTSSLKMFKSSMTAAWDKIFGSDSGFGIILTGVIGLMGVIIALYGWKAWKGGNPD